MAAFFIMSKNHNYLEILLLTLYLNERDCHFFLGICSIVKKTKEEESRLRANKKRQRAEKESKKAEQEENVRIKSEKLAARKKRSAG
jgi:hypothetical protein